MARQLVERGWHVTILTLHERYMEPLDEDMEVPGGIELIRTSMARPGVWPRKVAGFVRRAVRLGAISGPGRSAEKTAPDPVIGQRQRKGPWITTAYTLLNSWLAWLDFPDPWVGWVPFATRAVRDRDFDVVLGTIPPFTTALVARIVALESGGALALDYRDPWSDAPDRVALESGPRAPFYTALRRLEEKTLSESRIVFGTGPGICASLRQKTSGSVVYLPNTWDYPFVTPSADTPREKAIVYAGSLSYGRSLEPVLEAVRRLASETSCGRVEIRYAGPHGTTVRAQAAQLGVSDMVTDIGNVSHAAAREALKRCLAGIVIVSPRYEYMLPGKLFEVVGVGRPVLMIGPSTSEAASLVRRHNMGWCHEPTDIAGIANSLRLALGGEEPQPHGIEEFSAPVLGDRLNGGLRSIIRS